MDRLEAKARFKNAPHPPRKMRLLADIIRGQDVDYALSVLKHHPKKFYARKLEKLLLSSVANWKEKHGEKALEEADLYISEVSVDEGRVLKRVRPRAQGRAFLIRRRACHINLLVQNSNDVSHLLEKQEEEAVAEDQLEETEADQQNEEQDNNQKKEND